MPRSPLYALTLSPAEAQAEQPLLPGHAAGPWVEIRDGNPSAYSLMQRHYSRRRYRERRQRQFVGPGEKLVLMTPCARAIFVWRRFKDDSGQAGVNCAAFRNEGAGLSSDLIRSAMIHAWGRWPGERLYTYVNPAKIRSSNPGYCFLMAGWSRCGLTKGGLVILEASPAESRLVEVDGR